MDGCKMTSRAPAMLKVRHSVGQINLYIFACVLSCKFLSTFMCREGLFGREEDLELGQNQTWSPSYLENFPVAIGLGNQPGQNKNNNIFSMERCGFPGMSGPTKEVAKAVRNNEFGQDNNFSH